jgi:hypothetical protein
MTNGLLPSFLSKKLACSVKTNGDRNHGLMFACESLNDDTGFDHARRWLSLGLARRLAWNSGGEEYGRG